MSAMDPARCGIFQAGHLTDEALIQFLDDELASKDVPVAEAHLYSCWDCRARREEISRAISSIVEHQNAIAAPYLPPREDDRRIFLARLDALSAEVGGVLGLKRSIQRLFQFLRSGQRAALALAGALSVVAISAFIFLDLRRPTTVSAKEFLDRASASEAKSIAGQPHPVVIQRVRVQVDGKTLMSTVYRDLDHKRVASRPNMASQDESELDEIFRRSSFNWESLLDPDAYSRWRAGLQGESDAVTNIHSDLLKLETNSAAGPVAQATLTVRARDFHAVEETLRLRDDSQIQIAEESWSVVASASLPPGVFEPLNPQPVMEASTTLPLVAAHGDLPSDADLADSEMDVQSALHDVGADVGEQISVAIRPGRMVEVDGVIADDSRKHQLVDVLQNIRFVKVNLLTVEEAAAQETQKERSTGTTQVARVGQPPVQVVASAPPLLESQLIARFPDKDQRNQYVNQTLSLAQSASGRAWALNRLADQYPDQQISLLNSIERDKLHMLLTDHISALREDTSALLNQLGQVLSLASNTPAANAASDPSRRISADGPQGSNGWQDHIRRIHSSVDVVHESVAALIAGYPDNDKENVDTIELNLRTALNRLQAELQISDEQIRKTVGAPRETNR